MLAQFAAFAEYEASLISQRTKAALAAAKARGVTLGNPNGAEPLLRYHARRKASGASHEGTQAVIERATADAATALESIREVQAEGFNSQRQIADELNLRGIKSPRGKAWHQTTVARVLGTDRRATGGAG